MKSVETLLRTTFSGRRFTRRQLAQVQETVERFAKLSRTELAHTVCEHLNWKTPNGKNKVESCLILLEKLEAQGVVSLPATEATRSAAAASTDLGTRHTSDADRGGAEHADADPDRSGG